MMNKDKEKTKPKIKLETKRETKTPDLSKAFKELREMNRKVLELLRRN